VYGFLLENHRKATQSHVSHGITEINYTGKRMYVLRLNLSLTVQYSICLFRRDAKPSW